MRWRDWRQTEIGSLWTDEAIAAEVGAHVSTVARWDEVIPTAPNIVAIAYLTGFAVLPNDWFPDLEAVVLPLPPRLPSIRRRRRSRRAASDLALAA